VEIYLVPSKRDFEEETFIKDISFKVPAHQLNIYTIIQNKNTKQEIEFRNELRYSHGQFNGTPEAKFYISKGDMATLYRPIFSL
jgi:hypothetical protein